MSTMKTRKRRKAFLRLFEVAVLALWLIMIGLLMKRLHFKAQSGGLDSAPLAATIDSPQREWKEIYLRDKKVGYAVNMIRPFGEGYFIQEEIFLRLKLMGLASGIYTATQCRVDDQFLLKSFNFSIRSGVVAFTVSGRVEADELVVTSRKGKGRRTRRIKLSKPPVIGASVGHFLRSRRIRLGEQFKLPIFDPSTMAEKEAVIRVVAREPIKVNRIKYEAYRLETVMWGKPISFWLDKDGTTLKEVGFMGLTVIKSSAARAPRDLERQGDADFYEAASIPVENTLSDPARLNYLKLRVDGLDKNLFDPEVLNGSRQSFNGGIMEIRREKPTFKASYMVPYSEQSSELRTFLKPEFNIESDAEEILEKARKISGNNKDPVTVTRRLLSWVFHNLEKKPVVTVPSAIEVLRSRVGDCNEHATLLTALLRASGIPAKLSVGLVYSRGKFFYHAWTEAYIGEWVSMDATLNQMPVDASHIKLVEGNLDKQVMIAGVVGTMKLKVLDYGYD